MNTGKNITIVAFTEQRTRQATDLAGVLIERGHSVKTYQLWYGQQTGQPPLTPDYAFIRPPRAITAIARNPFLRRLRLAGIWRTLQLITKSRHDACDIVVAVNFSALLPAAILAWGRKAKLVYYALEFFDPEIHGNARIRRSEDIYCSRYVDMIMSVERNRLKMLTDTIKRRVPAFLVYNAPRAGIGTEPRGRLREYLARSYGVARSQCLVLYSGFPASYSRLEMLIEGTVHWDKQLCLVLMLTGAVSDELKALIGKHFQRVHLVPPVSHTELYAWVRDADIGLLPYEDDLDANVRYCSPQKMFDYLACGVPFVGSCRPLIEEVAQASGGGVCVDMLDSDALAGLLSELASDRARLANLARNARAAYENQYNFDLLADPAINEMLS